MADEGHRHQAHDKLFRWVYSDMAEAAGLLRESVPQWLSSAVDWPTLTLQDGSFVDDELRATQSDLLFQVEWRPGADHAGVGEARDAPQPLLVYVLLEHQSKPDRWMSFRLLQYCVRIWGNVLRADDGRTHLPPIVPVVFYQGRRGWHAARQFSDLFAEAVRDWPWTPRFRHVLVDQSQAEASDVRGGLLGRVAQLALMAAARPLVQAIALLRMVAEYLGTLALSGRFQELGLIVRYVNATHGEPTVNEFAAALRRHVPGPGGDMKTYAEELIEQGLQQGLQEGRQEGLRTGHQEGLQQGLQTGLQRGRQEGRQEGRHEGRHEGRQEGRHEGRQEGQIGTIQGLLRAGVEWSVIEDATGIDEATFRALRERLEGSDRTTG